MIAKDEFLEALRSGEYTQGQGGLRDFNNNYCCIGLYCQLEANEKWRTVKASHHWWSDFAESCNALDGHYAIRDFGTMLGVSEDIPLSVVNKLQVHMIHMNDGIGDFQSNPHTFEQIADWLEDDLEAFVEELIGDMRFTRV